MLFTRTQREGSYFETCTEITVNILFVGVLFLFFDVVGTCNVRKCIVKWVLMVLTVVVNEGTSAQAPNVHRN